MSNSKGQGSVEYLSIIAITMGIMVPLIFIFFSYAQESSTEIKEAQIHDVGRTLIETAEVVFVSGQNSKITVDVTMPDQIEGMRIIGNRELVFNVTSGLGQQDLVFFSSVNITADVCTGPEPICILDSLAFAGGNKIRLISINNGSQVRIEQA